jgi:hypothetical protein
MRASIVDRLRQFWDAGIRGPDFVWAATGPAMDSYSRYPVVKKADAPGERMDVAEFLDHVRREVVDFAVGRVLSGNGHADSDADRLDKVTAYYLLHRTDYGFEEVPSGACILYAISCGLSDSDLDGTYDLATQSGSEMQLLTWDARSRPQQDDLDPSAPMIDKVHRLLYLWDKGDVSAVNAFIDDRGLKESGLFQKVLQALIELASGQERSRLESISNHIKGRRARRSVARPSDLFD